MINLILYTRSFTETILYDLILLLAVLIIIYILGKGGSKKAGDSLMGLNSIMSSLIIALSIAMFILGLFPLDSFKRSSLYFVFQGILALIIIVLYVREGRISNSVIIFYTVMSFLSVPVVVYLKNNFYPIYDLSQEALYTTGSIEAYMKGSIMGKYYYFIPVDPLIIVPLAYVCGESISFLLPVIRNFVFYLVILLSIFGIIKRTSLRSFYASMLTYAIAPTLSFQDRILSLPYTTLIIYLLFSAINSGKLSREFIIILVIISLVAAFAHPIGPLTLLSALLFLVIFLKIFMSKNEMTYKTSSTILLIFTLITFAYWFLTYIYTILVSKAIGLTAATIQFIDTLLGRGEIREILSGTTISKYTAPGYRDPNFYIYAYSWALPLAITLFYLPIGLLEIIFKKNIQKVDKLITIQGLAFSHTTLIFIGSSYIGYAFNVEPGQYLIPAGYYASTIVVGVALYKYNKLRKLSFTILAVLIAFGVGLGLYSPNWAPLEHPNFGSSIIIFPSTNYIETNSIADHLSSNLVIYSVNDFPIGAQGKLPNYVLDQIRLGNIAKFNNVLIGIGVDDQILKTRVQYISILYSTGRHVLALVTV